MEKKSDNSLGVGAVVLGIISIVFSLTIIFSLFSFIPSIVGLIFALKQRKVNPNKWTSWGLWLCGISLVIFVIFFIILASIIIETMHTIQNCINNPSLPGCEQITQVFQQSGYSR